MNGLHIARLNTDGTLVTADLTTAGIIDGTGSIAEFQTFTFGPEFSSLTRVEIPTYDWCLDNLHVSRNVPEPAPLAILLLAGFLMVGWRFRACLKTPVWCPAFRLPWGESTLKRGHQTFARLSLFVGNRVFKQALRGRAG